MMDGLLSRTLIPTSSPIDYFLFLKLAHSKSSQLSARYDEIVLKRIIF